MDQWIGLLYWWNMIVNEYFNSAQGSTSYSSPVYLEISGKPHVFMDAQLTTPPAPVTVVQPIHS